MSDCEAGLRLILADRMAKRSTKRAQLRRDADSVHAIAQMTYRELLRSPRFNTTTSVVVPDRVSPCCWVIQPRYLHRSLYRTTVKN
jgi:hypothetical protein